MLKVAPSLPAHDSTSRPGGIDRSRDFADDDMPDEASTFLLFSLWPRIISFPFLKKKVCLERE
eukprot:COSAG01_NODE_139_length_24311_cov_75.405873_15_plen_63_part_00